MDLVAGAVEEAGVDEDDPVAGRVHGGGEVERGAPLLVHQADLERAWAESEQRLDPGEQRAGERHLVGPVLLGLDDVDRPGPAVAPGRVGPQSRQRADRGDDGVEDALEHLRALGVEDRVGRHQVADVPDQQQGAAGKGERLARRVGVRAVRLQPPVEGGAVLPDRGAEVAHVEAEPVAVRRDLVLGVDGGDRVLEVDDRGDGRLGQHVLDPGRVGPADRPGPVDDELEVQAVVAQQHPRRGIGVAGVPGERGRVGQPGGAGRGRGGEAVGGDEIAGRLPVRSAVEGHRLVEGGPHGPDHQLPAHRVVGPVPGGPVGLGDRVGPVERVVERSPARVGGVDREPGVGHRDHQLRARDRGDLRIDPVGGDLERPRAGDEIADLLQERTVLGRVVRLAGVRPVPGVDRRLELIATAQQVPVDRRQVGDDLRHPRPEGRPGHADARGGQRLVLDEAVQVGRDLQPGCLGAVSHGDSFVSDVGLLRQQFRIAEFETV